MKMVTLKVNGSEITAPEGMLLIDACEQNGIHIPRFCYHEGLFPSGNCRLCLVRIEKNPKPVPSCMTRVVENMVVTTETPELQEMRKAILEYTLIHHPLDCPICDKAGECQLQDQYMKYSGADSRFHEKKIAKGKLYKFSERIIYDAERCITCTRCVRFTRDISKSNKLGMIKRGDRSYVSLAPGDTFDDPYSYCVTDICPVGALTSRQFRFKERVWNLQQTDSICAGCSRGCNISIQHKNDKIYRILPRFNGEINKHWMCDFGRDYMLLHQPQTRLTGSQIAGKSVKYDLFLSSVAETLKKIGSKTCLILSSHATNEELAEAQKLCDKLKISAIYKKSDRTWHSDSNEPEKDNFLITSDKTPNLKGVSNYFPSAKEIGEYKADGFECAFVWGTGAPAEKLTGLKIILLSTVVDKVTAQTHWLIAGRLPVEKSGSFTNPDGKVQSFRQAIHGQDNFDDLKFLKDLIERI